MNYEYHVINEAYQVIKVYELEEEALTFVEQYRQYSYVKELKYDIKHLEFLLTL